MGKRTKAAIMREIRRHNAAIRKLKAELAARWPAKPKHEAPDLSAITRDTPLTQEEAGCVRRMLRGSASVVKCPTRVRESLRVRGIWVQRENPLHEGVFFYLMKETPAGIDTLGTAKRMLAEYDAAKKSQLPQEPRP
jgi:hypothetical protein